MNHTPPPITEKLTQIIRAHQGRYTRAAVALGIYPPTFKSYLAGKCSQAKRIEIETAVEGYVV